MAKYDVIVMLRQRAPAHVLSETERARAREIVERYGHDTLSYFGLRDSGTSFFDDTEEAFLSYKLWHNVALIGADPIGPPDAIKNCTEQFLRFCELRKLTPCFLGVSGRNLEMYRALGLRILKIGEECLIRLPGFDPSKLKRKVRRAERHGVDLGITSTTYSPSDLPKAARDQAMLVSEEWIRARGGFERGFSMTLGRFPDADDAGCRILIATQESRVIGFLTLMPVYQVRGWSLDMMRRATDAPNGLTEFMIIQAARVLQAEGGEFMSLNFASLSHTASEVFEPQAITILRRLCFDHLSSLFQMKTLYTFNDKFQPEWASRYVAFRHLSRAGTMLAAIIQAEDPITLPGVGR